MGVPLNGYRTSRLLRSSGHSRVYEAIRETDGDAVVAKVFDLEGDHVEPRVEHEFALIEALDVDGVVKALGLQRVGDQLVLLLERVAGVNLAEYAAGQRQPLELEQFFAIAIQIADVLGRVHARRIIHRDIKPTNILIEPDTGRVFLADFGISVLLETERRRIYDPVVLEGTLPYISPEQTGRTGRAVDFRSDLYSLGVTFYELLTGRRPFEFAAPLELIHAHLARIPEPPRTRRPELPDGLSRLIMKLLEKAPEHRYQTAVGLAADLRKLRELVDDDDEGRALVLGREDFPRSLQLPHQLYGRMRERHELVDELERIMRTGNGRVMLLAGPPGIGKSSLLADFEGPVAGFGGYLARGKFEPNHEQPYSGFVEAFTGLIEQVLTESEARLRYWRQRLTAALGGVAGVICELVPNLELVIGPRAPIPELEPHEARNRLHLAIARFLSAFCEEDPVGQAEGPGARIPEAAPGQVVLPLVVVLDDLHWADRSSLALLRALVDGGRRGALLILGSFREDALEPVATAERVDGATALHELIAALADHHRVRVTRLRPLTEAAVETLLADTLARPIAEVRPLAQIVGRKTDNNPLFIRQFLTHLAEQGLLCAGERGWTWDEQAIEAAAIHEDVLAVMTAKLAAIPERSRDLLARAACIGARFDVSALEIVCQTPRAALTPTLYALVETGLLAALDRGYRFAHDRIKDAALALLDDDERVRLHLRYGRHLLAAAGDDPGDRLFEIVDHLDAGLVEPIAEAPLDDRLELATLNLKAGVRALDTAAYDPALRYLEQGIALVEDLRDAVIARGEEAPHYELVVALYFARAQALAMSARNDDAQEAFDALLGWRLGLIDYGRVAARRIRLLSLRDQSAEAVELGLEALARCGYGVPREPSRVASSLTLVRAWLSMRKRSLEQLRAVPDCTDEGIGAVMEIVTATKTAAYVVNPNLFVLLIGLHIKLFIRHGFHPSCPLALGQLAMGVGSGLRKVEDAIRLCELGLELAARVPDSPALARVTSAAYLFVWHLGRPFAEPIAKLEEAYPRALEAGDFEYAGYMGALGLSMHFDTGTHLRVVERLSRRLEDDIGRWGSHEMVLVAWMIRGFCLALAGPEASEQVDPREAAAFEQAIDPEAVEARGGSRISVYAAISNRACVRLLLGKADEALGLCVRIIADVEQVILGSWVVPRTALTTVVAAATVLARRHGVAPEVHAAMRKGLAIVRRWARNSTENYGHYLDLAEGMRAATRGNANEAMRRIERARVHAEQQGCRWVEGLAAEQLAAIAEREGLAAFASGAYQRAWEAYAAWGAGAKLEQLRESLPDRFDPLARPGRRDKTRSSQKARRRRRASERGEGPEHSGGSFAQLRSSATSAESLDFASVLESVRVMTEDLRLDEVVGRVLHAAITNAGADRGVLLLERDGVLGVVAEASVAGERRTFDAPIRMRDAAQLCPTSLVNFVLRTEQALVLDDARVDPRFASDEYVIRTGVQSLLGMPVVKGKRRLGALVLENRLSAYCFTPERLEALTLITGQAAAALDNARLYTALRRSEARWRSLVDGAPDVIALLNERGEMDFINRSNMLESGDEPGGRLLEMFLSSASAEQWRAAVATVLREGVERELEIEVVREHTQPRWYTARLAPIEPEVGGGARRAVAVATDITERKRAEADKHALEAQLRQQQRLESVGTLASGVAHEINNPVQGILNYAELIGDNADNQKIVREFAAEITTESNRVASIVRNLLAFSRQEREQRMEDAAIDEVIEATLSLIRAVMRRDHVQLNVAIPRDLPRVRCRVQQIQQIVMNLVTNARDALNERYSGYDERKLIEIRAEPRIVDGQAWVRVIVEDHGPGIPPDVLQRIFDPFFTTKGRDQGTGLGLAVSHGIAKDHGGDLSVETVVGERTRFLLDLPAATD